MGERTQVIIRPVELAENFMTAKKKSDNIGREDAEGEWRIRRTIPEGRNLKELAFRSCPN